MKAAICSRVTFADGAYVVGVVPVVIPVFLSHSICLKNSLLAGTSVNVGFDGGLKAGEAASRYMKAAICPRVTFAVGANVVGVVPVVIPVCLSHSICLKNSLLAGTSVKVGFDGGLNVGEPANRYMNAAICPRVTFAAGAYVVGVVPVVTPVVFIQHM